MSAPSDPLRIGVLSASRIGSLSIGPPAAKTGHRLVAVAARNPERARDWAAENNVERVLDSYEALIADPEVEAIYNPLPNGLHGEWNLKAIQAGKHVLSEKPFASNASQARDVVAAAAAAGLVVLEAFHYPYHPNFARIQELITSGAIGEVRHLEAPMRMADPGAGDPRWFLHLAGGATMDVGCYSINVARLLGRQLGGEPEIVSVSMTERAGQPGVDESMTAELRYPSGATASIGGTMVAPEYDFHLTIEGSQGRIHLPEFPRPHLDDTIIWSGADGVEQVESGQRRSSYTYQLEAFAAAIRAGAPLPYNDPVTQMEFVDAVYRAAGFDVRPVTVG